MDMTLSEFLTAQESEYFPLRLELESRKGISVGANRYFYLSAPQMNRFGFVAGKAVCMDDTVMTNPVRGKPYVPIWVLIWNHPEDEEDLGKPDEIKRDLFQDYWMEQELKNLDIKVFYEIRGNGVITLFCGDSTRNLRMKHGALLEERDLQKWNFKPTQKQREREKKSERIMRGLQSATAFLSKRQREYVFATYQIFLEGDLDFINGFLLASREMGCRYSLEEACLIGAYLERTYELPELRNMYFRYQFQYQENASQLMQDDSELEF